MRQSVKEFVEYARDHYSLSDPIFDVCAGWEPNYYQVLFPDKKYFKQDQVQYDPPSIDYVCDAHNMHRIEKDSMGTVLLLEALEHLQQPQVVVDEIYRILRPGGYCIATTVMTFEIHRTPYDYWRFCPDGICYLFRAFRIFELVLEHNRLFPRGIWCICQKPKAGVNVKDQQVEFLPKVRVHESGKSSLRNLIKKSLNMFGIDILRLPKNINTIEVIGKNEANYWKQSR